MKRLKILFVSVVLGTLFVFQMSGNAATSTITYTKGNDETGTITTQDTTYTAGSNISISNNVISAAVPSISITSNGAIQNQNGNSLTAKYIDLSNPSSVKTGSSISATAATTYLIFQKDYLPLVAYAEKDVDDESFIFKV